jgi:sensor c-di-GMP phosphodiesterase-like protein
MKGKLLRRDRMFIAAALTALAGAALLFGLITRLLWEQSMRAEEARVEQLARDMGLRAESMIVDTLEMLESFDRSSAERCGPEHVDAMHRAAIAKPYIRSIGYWQAAERLCGVGFNQSIELKPARADRIYESGVVAWWPGPQTAIGGTELFLMRYGDHDVAIDPRMLLQDLPDPNRRAALWVEDLPMAATGDAASLPAPDELAQGLTLDNDNRRILSRFSFGKIFPMDVVAVDSIQGFRDRYLPTLAAAGGLGLALAAVWIYLVLRYSRHRMSLATELKQALQNGRITAYYQPIVELESGRCVGAEALARWIREDGEVVSPEVFIPLAEQNGLMNRLSLAVIDALVRDLRSLLREFPLLRINLNLAPENLGSTEFLRRLRHRLANASISPQRVKLEITERAMINSDRSRQLVRELRERGHQIAIDDFGTGYSSLGYLQTFELDTLKIDKSFVDAIGTEAVTNHVVGHVIDMAASLKLDTVAEGIEYPRQAAWLRAHGVAYGQGFLYSEAVPAEPFSAFFRARNQTDTVASDDAAQDVQAAET